MEGTRRLETGEKKLIDIGRNVRGGGGGGETQHTVPVLPLCVYEEIASFVLLAKWMVGMVINCT